MILHNRQASHRFSWLQDDEVGEISHEWNWLVGCTRTDGPRALHYTEGDPVLKL